MREWHLFENEPWRNDSACRGYPTGWWYPERGHGKDEAKKARAICQHCPVQEACLDHALSRMEDGIWGNTSTKQRQAIRRAGMAEKRLICQECRNVFTRPALDSRGMRPYCSRACYRRAANRRAS